MAGVRVHQPWQQDSRIISGASLNCSAIRGLLPLGSNPSGGDDLANILGLIRQCPNGQEASLVRSLELVHRLVRLYPARSLSLAVVLLPSLDTLKVRPRSRLSPP